MVDLWGSCILVWLGRSPVSPGGSKNISGRRSTEEPLDLSAAAGEGRGLGKPFRGTAGDLRGPWAVHPAGDRGPHLCSGEEGEGVEAGGGGRGSCWRRGDGGEKKASP